VRPPQVVPVCAGEHGRQHGDAAATDPDLAAAQLAGDDDAPPARGVWALGVLDPAAAGAPQVPVVQHRVVGDQQLERGVVDVDLDLDVAGRDLRGAQVQHRAAAVRAHLEPAGRGPVAEPLGHRVVRGDPDGLGEVGVREVHHGGSSWGGAAIMLRQYLCSALSIQD
jgi:hypothetical protein